MKKRLCLLALTVATLTVPINTSANHDVRVKLDENYVTFSEKPFFENSRAMVPARGLFEKMGAKVRWDDKENAAWIEDEYMSIKLVVGNNTAYIYHKYDFTGIPQEVKMDVAPKVIGNRTFIPLRFMAESLEADVLWEESTSTAVIDTKKKKVSVEYKVLSESDIKDNAELMKWYNSNYKNKGIHYKIDGEKAYVIASAGERTTGGYGIKIDKITKVPSGNIHITAKVLNPAPDAMVTQAISYPNILISFDSKDIKHIQGVVHVNSKDHTEKELEYEIVSSDVLKADNNMIKWYDDNRNTKGIHYKRDNSYVYVLAGAGEKSTGGYSVKVQNVVSKTPDEAYIYGTVLSPDPGAIVTEAITYPHTLLRIKSDVIKHVGGEIKDETNVKKTLKDIGAGIRVEEVKSVQLFNLEQQKIKEYSRDEIAKLVEAYNNGQIDDSAYIEMLYGNSMKIALKDDSKINIISYGSKTNIVVNVEKKGEHASYHLVCPEIAKILVGK